MLIEPNMNAQFSLPTQVKLAVFQTSFELKEFLAVPEMAKLLQDTCLKGGKRVRPALCYLMSGVLGFPLKQTKLYARSAEFVHSASLAHDDVLDEATTRRGKPTLNEAASNKKAILAGDLLLARVIAEITLETPRAVIIELAQTIEELVQGEWLQAEAVGVANISPKHLETVASLKTASLIRWCFVAPALSVPIPNGALIDLCRDLGTSTGLAFQMVDDVLDFDESSGKDFAKDLREGLINTVSAEMLESDSSYRTHLEKIGVQEWSNPFWSKSALEQAKAKVRAKAQFQIKNSQIYLQEIANIALVSGNKEQMIFFESFNQALNAIGARKI